MTHTLNNPFIKSLLPFSISILGPWTKKMFTETPKSLTSLLLDINEHAHIADDGGLKSLLDLSPSSSASIAIEAYNSLFWFIAVVIILEVSIFLFSIMKSPNQRLKHLHSDLPQQSSSLEGSQGVQKTRKTVFSSQKDAIAYILKSMLEYGLCYFFYTMIFAAVCYASNTGISQQQLLTQPGPSPNELRSRSLEEIYPAVPEQNYSIESNETTSTNGNERFLQSLNSILVQPLFETGLTVTGIVLSNNDTIAFLAVVGEFLESCSLQIIDISIKSSPQVLGTISFGEIMPYFPSLQNANMEFKLALSSDGNTIFMSAGPALQIIDVSNLTAPVIISNYSLASNEFIQSITLTSDGNYALLNFHIYNDSQSPESYIIQVLNISDITSPQPINDLINTTAGKINCLSVYEESIYVQIGQNLLIFSDIQDSSPTYNLSFPLSESIISFDLSSDSQTAFVIFDTYHSLYLQIFNISNNTVSNFSQAFSLSSTSNSDYLAGAILSTDNIHLFITQGSSLLIFDASDPNNLTAFPQTGINSMSSFALCSDGQTVLASDGDSFYIVELILDIQAAQAFQIEKNVFATISLPNDINSFNNPIYSIALSPNGTILYVSLVSNYPSGYLLTADVSNPSSPVWGVPLQTSQLFSGMIISADGNYLFGSSSTYDSVNFQIYEISSMQEIFNIAFPIPMASSGIILPDATITPDDSMALFMPSMMNFLLYNISDRANPSMLCNYTLIDWISGVTIEFTQDSQAVIIAGVWNSSGMYYNGLHIYDVSLPSDPKLLTTFQFQDPPITITLSADENVVFILTEPSYEGNQCTFNALNISSLTAPTLISSMSMSISCVAATIFVEPLTVSMQPNAQVLLVPSSEALIAIDISTPAGPKLLDYYNLNVILGMALTPDGSSLYIADHSNIIITTFIPENILFMDPSSVPLGTQYTNTLNVLAKNSINTYDAKISNFNFIDIYLYSPSFNDMSLGDSQTSQESNGFKSLPNWMIADKNNGLMTLEPNSQYQIGSYSIYGSLSTQITNNTFVNVGSINNTNDSMTLLTTLMIYGYVDNQFYLTSNFDPNQSLILPLQYQDYEPQYRGALAAYFLEAWTIINITSSLTLTLLEPSTPPPYSTPPIVINTQSFEPLTIIITLEGQGSQPMFVTIGYPFSVSFSQNNSAVSMVKSLADVNSTIPQLIIYLNGSNSCSGNITVTDGLNPTLNQFVPNISSYFMISSQPSINTTYLASQIAKVEAKTGEQFVMQFDSSTFTDSTNQALTLTIQMQDSSLQVPEWLELKGYTLTGTPPEQLTGRDFDLKLIVSNQYQSTETGFTLSVGISVEYALKMIGTIGGALATAIGFLVYATDIYNILCKKCYRYSKDFIIRSDQDIVPRTLYPILFAEEYLQESRLIIKQIDKRISQHLKDNSPAKIASYFTDSNSYKIEEGKLSTEIGESATQIRNDDQTKLTNFFAEKNSHREIIIHVITNEFIVRLLDLEAEKPTKKAFEQIKDEIFSFVDIDKCLQNGLCAFSVNRSKLLLKLKDYNKTNLSLNESEDKVDLPVLSSMNANASLEPSLTPRGHKSIEKGLIPSSVITLPSKQLGLNIELMTAAIEAYACNHHIIDADIASIEVIGRRRQAKIWPLEGIRRFLKQDLKMIGFSGKALVGYGIKYKVQKNLLVFYGTANEKIRDNTIVVQILNRKGKILREIWMHGVEDKPENKSLVEGVL